MNWRKATTARHTVSVCEACTVRDASLAVQDAAGTDNAQDWAELDRGAA